MKKKNILLMILPSTILILGITISCAAWFTTKTKATSNIILNTGTLDIKLENNRWILQNKETSEVTNKDSNNNFNNVKPGDVFVKNVNLRNTGSLRQRLNFSINRDLPNNLNNILKVEIKDLHETTLPPNGTKDIQIKLTLKKDATKDEVQDKNINFKTINATNFININVVQINMPREHIIKFTGIGNNPICDIKFDFAEGKIKAISTGNQAHYGFGKNPYIHFELKDYKGKIKVKSTIKGNDNGNNFINALNNIEFNTGDKIILNVQELNRISISRDNGVLFNKFSIKGAHRANKVLKVTERGLQEIN